MPTVRSAGRPGARLGMTSSSRLRRGGSSPSSLWYGPNPSVRFCGQVRFGAGPPREPRFCPDRSVERPRSPVLPEDARGGRPSLLRRGRSDPEPWRVPFAGGRARRGEPSLLVPEEARGGRPSPTLRLRSDPDSCPSRRDGPARRLFEDGLGSGPSACPWPDPSLPNPTRGAPNRRASVQVAGRSRSAVAGGVGRRPWSSNQERAGCDRTDTGKQAPPPLQCSSDGGCSSKSRR